MGKIKSTKGDVKEEKKRYFLCEYCGLAPEKKPRVFYTEEGLENFLKQVRRLNEQLKNNTDSNEHLKNCGINQLFYGNVTYVKENGRYRVFLHVYNRLTPRMTISEIDALTSDKTEDEIIEQYRRYLRTEAPNKPDINIMYFEEKNKNERKENTPIVRIKYTPILYKDGERYMQRSYVEGAVKNMARLHDYTFFNEMANEFCFYHVVGDEIDNLRHYVDLCRRGEDYYAELSYHAMQLYDKLIKERKSDNTVCRDKNAECLDSKRRIRDFGFFVRDYMLPADKRINPMKYRYQLTPRQLELLKLKAERKQIKEKQKQNKEQPKAEQLNLLDMMR